ncbi:MAG: acetyl-CoA C-acyltransferase family protein [Beijerinckiaceae bacterium]
MARDVVILDGVRTAVGGFGGSLKDHAPTKLGAIVIAEALRRAGVDAADVQQTVMGHVINTEPKDMYLSRVSAIEAGVPVGTPAMNVNRLCGSGLQAIVSATQAIQLGDADIAVAGGAESMSRSPHSTQSLRSGQKMGDLNFTDMMLGALNDPFGNGHMGITAENVAAEHQISRLAQDAFAAESHRRATLAIKEGRFASQIVPIEVRKGKEMVMFATDEHARADVTEASLAGLKPVFKKDGSVTAGNASGLNDGAGAVVLMEAGKAAARGLKPKARILGYGLAGVEPKVMGIGPVPAVTNLLKRIGMTAADFDVVESNEAFAAQACAVTQSLGLDPRKVNPNGGAVALGHPIGATGAVIRVKALYELERTGGKRAICTMCIGGGQGIAIAIERI